MKGGSIDRFSGKYYTSFKSIKSLAIRLAGFYSGIVAFLSVLLKWEERLEGSVSSTIKQCSLILVSRIMEIWTDPIQKLTYSLWMMRCPIWLWYKSLKEKKETYNFFFSFELYYTHVAAVWVIVNQYWAVSTTCTKLPELWRHSAPARGRRKYMPRTQSLTLTIITYTRQQFFYQSPAGNVLM